MEGSKGGMISKGEGDRVMVKRKEIKDTRRGNKEERVKRNNHNKIFKPFHYVFNSNFAIAPGEFSVFGDDVNQIMVLNYGFKLVS